MNFFTHIKVSVLLITWKANELLANGSGENGEIESFRDLTGLGVGLIMQLVTFLIAIGFIFFFWGLVKFIIASNKGDSQGIEGGKQVMIWGVIGLFVILSVGSLVSLLGAVFWDDFSFPLLPTGDSD